MINKKIDIVIVGGGLIGATLLLALANKGYEILLIDNRPLGEKIQPPLDVRTLALSPASIRIAERINIWPLLREEATPIHSIHVSDQYHFGTTRLERKTGDSLGYVVEIQQINQALYQLINKDQILAPSQIISLELTKKLLTVKVNEKELTIQAKLIIAADGTDSKIRDLVGLKAKEKNYNQYAIVANIELARGHGNQAFERFTLSGPLALLPMRENKMSLVWAVSPEKAKQLMGMEKQKFLQILQIEFGYRVGKFIDLGQRGVFPLRQVIMPCQTKWPIVFVGNASHTLHPVAGQGFNLGLRDVAALAQCILSFGLQPSMLQQYESMRYTDQSIITKFTDLLIKVFTSQVPGISFARNIFLLVVDNSSFLKRQLSTYARGFGGLVSDLISGIDLPEERK